MVRVTGTVNNYKEGAAGSYSTALCIHVPRSRIARRDMLDAFSRGTTAQRPASRARSPPDLGTGGMQGWAETDGGARRMCFTNVDSGGQATASYP